MRNLSATIVLSAVVLAGCPVPAEPQPGDDAADDADSADPPPVATAGETGTPDPAAEPKPGATLSCEDELERAKADLAKAQVELAACQEAK